MKLVSPELLVEPQRSILQGYSRFFPSGAVCVNVMLGAEPWDIRPLLLLFGKVSLARFSMTLAEGAARSLSEELQGFSVLCNKEQRVQSLAGEGRFMLMRPYYSQVLSDGLDGEDIREKGSRIELAASLIRIVAGLGRRGIAHGHVSPSNIVRQKNKVLLVDPVLGALHQSGDAYLAPETTVGQPPKVEADIFGLAQTIKTLLDGSLTPRQSSVVQEALLPVPRQRPPIEEIAAAFDVQLDMEGNDGLAVGAIRTRGVTSAGRVLKSSSTEVVSQGEEGLLRQHIVRGDDPPRVAPKKNSGWYLTGIVAAGFAVWVVKERYPAQYFELVSRFPMLAAQHSAEYEADWASRDKSRMAIVGRAGVIRREPAAVNTILNDLVSGANPENVNGALMRVALADSWRDELAPSDIHTTLVFTLDQLVPEGRSQLGVLNRLHPGVILAVLGQSSPNMLPPELVNMSIDTLSGLPAPFGELFSQVKAMGSRSLGDSAVIALAAIVTGNVHLEQFERFLGNDRQAAQTLAKVSLIAPVVFANENAVADLLMVLGDRGGETTALVRWFDVIDIAGWGGVAHRSKLSLILGDLPADELTVPQLADLLGFPLEGVRQQAAGKLKDLMREVQAERLLSMLATPAHGLSREQSVALIAALSVPTDSRAPFIPAWFNMNPPPEGVLLTLLSRSHLDASDMFNLEAARYLRRTTWKATTDMLKLLAMHPEPLARVLAYSRLDPSIESDRSILLESQLREKNESCSKVLAERLSNFKKDAT